MDRSTHVTLGGFLVGLVVGFGAGWLYHFVRVAWNNVAAVKSAVGPTRRTAWGRTGELVVLGFLLAVVAALALGGINER